MLRNFIHLKLNLRIFLFPEEVQHASSTEMFTFAQLL